MTLRDLPIEELSDRELLILTAQRVNEICRHVEIQDARIEMQNVRVRMLEDWRNLMVGAMGVITIVVPVATAWIVSLLVGGGK